MSLAERAPRGAVSRATLHTLYPAASPQPLWVRDGRPTTQARTIVRALLDIGSHGLDPRDYDTDSVASLVAALDTRATASAGVIARADVMISLATMRVLAHLHQGRIDPRTVGFDVGGRRSIDLAGLAATVSRSADAAAALYAVEPPHEEYAELLRALARYRALAADPSLRPPHPVRRALRAGGAYADAPALRRLLSALGDFSADGDALMGADSLRYDSTLAEAVRAFQLRHALDVDGVVGPATMAQLRVPLARRARQIELSLERFRWLPDSVPERYIVVNAPAFRLYAFDRDSPEPQPALRMKVIVGQAQKRHGTPVFAATMREVVFRPFWDVPPRITREEIVPKLRRRPAAYAAEGFEIVRGGETDAVGYPLTEANLQSVLAGSLRVRQRPGPDNPLGGVKLVFPNPYNVYLHGTPSVQLFAHTRRDFSHGCIRVEDPAGLTGFVLDDSVTWSPEAIAAAMNGDLTFHVRLPRPVAVYVLYLTAVADRDGRVFFYSDLYGRDVTLDRALTAGTSGSAPQASGRGGHSPTPGAGSAD